MAETPLALIAELTHRCPLRCVYCSNPIELAARNQELTSEQWGRVFIQAAELGIVHAHFTGGEPLLRPDLIDLVSAARKSGLYVNLITSGVGLDQARLDSLVTAGVDHIQLSFQDFRQEGAASISGVDVLQKKLVAAKIIRSSNVAFTVNLVVHRQNLDSLQEMIESAAALGPSRIEIAHVQYYGWALKNRDFLLPTRDQVDRSMEIIAQFKERLAGKIHIEFVTPDYYGKFPKPCMGGWGRRLILIDPRGQAMPCHAASTIPNLRFDNVREHSLSWIWTESKSFNLFRGTEWLQEPCRECPRKEQDFGGCRCQALLMTGDAAHTDPVCSLSPDRKLIDGILQKLVKEPPPVLLTGDLQYRVNPSN